MIKEGIWKILLRNDRLQKSRVRRFKKQLERLNNSLGATSRLSLCLVLLQGGTAITRKPWCDFVMCTYFMNRDDIHIDRIFFDLTFWEALRKKLLDFYLYAMVPEPLTGRVKRVIPMYPKIFSYK